MARTDARLELRKARKATAALELNPLLVVRYEAVLQGSSLPPSLACSPGLVLPSLLQGQSTAPVLATSAGLVHPGHLSAELAAPVAVISVTVVIEATLASTTRAVLHDFEAGYDINVYRGPSHTSAGDWDRSALVTTAVASDWQRPALTPATCPGDWQEAGPLMAVVVDLSEQLPRHHEPVRGLFDEALPLNASHGQGFDSLPPGHAVTRSLWVEGAPVGRWQVSGFRNPPRQDKVWQADHWQEATPLGFTLGGQRWQLGLQLHKGWLSRWEEAMQPPWGMSPPPKPPIKPERPDKRTKALAFGRPRGDASLEFVWYPDNTHVIPTKRVYFVTNSVSIVRASDGRDIPCSGVSCEFDYDSWAWTFSATILSVAAAQSVYGQEVIISINGHQWRMKVDTWRDNRSWGQQSATLGGRGLTAELSSSVMLETSYSEPAARTMVQLATERLPPGWTLDWRAADWLVPGGVYGFEKASPISALQELAEAAAAFLLPDPMNRHIIVLPKYPTAPWAFAGAIADIVIPEPAMMTLGEDHMDGQNVNGVHVGGKDVGVVGRVYRQGSGADRLLPDITHELCVDVLAARVLGIEALAKAGPRTNQEIEMGISSDTGLILPGKLIQTSKGRGYSRSIKASAKVDEKQRLVVRQVISIERGGT